MARHPGGESVSMIRVANYKCRKNFIKAATEGTRLWCNFTVDCRIQISAFKVISHRLERDAFRFERILSLREKRRIRLVGIHRAACRYVSRWLQRYALLLCARGV